MKEITIEDLKGMESGIFASDTLPKENGLQDGVALRWVAVRGNIHDWCIYYHQVHIGEHYIKDYGDKVYDEKLIRELVPCTDEAFGMYRN